MAKYVFLQGGFTIGDKVFSKGDITDTNSLGEILSPSVQELRYGKIFYVEAEKAKNMFLEEEGPRMENATLTLNKEEEEENIEEEDEEEEAPKPKPSKNKKRKR
jgi:hypothetical protein